jgi:pullulanase
MKYLYLILVLTGINFMSKAQISKYDSYPVYAGKGLGLTYTPQQSIFKIWAPSAQQVRLFLYKDISDKSGTTYPMIKEKNGVWMLLIKGDKENSRYTFQVMIDNAWLNEVTDPYTKAVTVNGLHGMIIDFKKTNPVGWNNDKSPLFSPLSVRRGVGGEATDAIIYELHIRDASIASSSGIINKGKFTGLIEIGTKNKDGFSTGLDHLKELGVTHIHLLPFFDFNSVDESKPDKPQYNWGYDPQNYNVPEGSYATNANDGITRIKEFKQLVQTFHKNGLRVVMDVVYNHTALTENSNFNQLVPGYYYRQTKDNKFSNATACGNETASERPMMRKFMLESMKYWVQEYHIDGFRIDLMGVHDIETMNLISKELHKIKPSILLYGEGWTAGASPLPDSLRALKKNASKLDRIAVFSDDIRDGIKGSVFEHNDKGFASGKSGMEESIKFGIVASCNHPQIDYSKVNYSKAAYAKEPFQTITYAECHDNHVLWDKLAISAKDATRAERIQMHKLALSIVLSSQGIPFLHAGTEFLRSKKGVENSFNSSDSINAIDWNLKSLNKDVFDYVQLLIKMRKDHPAFRMKTGKEIASNIRFRENAEPGTVIYEINGSATGDAWKKILVCFNGSNKSKSIIAGRNMKSFIINNQFVQKENVVTDLILNPFSCTILFEK